MAQWSPVLVGNGITRSSQKNMSSSKVSAIPLCLCTWNEMFDCSFAVTTSWRRCPLVKRNGSKASLLSKYDGMCTEKFHSDGNTAMEASFLNRVMRWDPTSGRAELVADMLRFAMLLRGLRLEKSAPVVTLVVNRPKSEERLLRAGAKPLHAEDTTLCRSVKVRVNYLALGRPDLILAAGPLAMKSPTTKDLEEVKRVGRYLRGRPAGAIVF